MERKEYFIDAPWGKVAFLTWGDSNNKPVFLCHGEQDSAVTFEPLVKLLPDDHFYAAIDLPGNGKSDSHSRGMPLWYVMFAIPAVSLVIEHLKWKKFVFIGHSMGTAVGDFYNMQCPGRMERIIHLDPFPMWIATTSINHVNFMRRRLETHYRNYSKDFSAVPKTYTRDQAVAVVQKARRLTPEAARLVTERNLVPVGDGKYRLRWEQRAKWLIILGLSREYYVDLLARSRTPTLILEASVKLLQGYDDLLPYMKRKILGLNPLNRWSVVDGNHDFHLCVPNLVAPKVANFLTMNVEGDESKGVKCKL